jgi:hypothetical protein
MSKNTYYLLLFPAIALARVAVGDTARPTPAPAEFVHVGKREIRLPAPEGYFRFTGYNERVDQSLKNTGPHHLLVAFSSQDDVARVLDGKFPERKRSFSAQSFEGVEVVTVARFRAVKSATRAAWNDVPKVESMTKEVASLLSQRGIRIQVDIKEIKDQFGVFDETEDSISCLQIVASVKSDTPSIRVLAHTTVKVCDRVIVLFCSSDYMDQRDVDWVKSSITQWRDKILAANPL